MSREHGVTFEQCLRLYGCDHGLPKDHPARKRVVTEDFLHALHIDPATGQFTGGAHVAAHQLMSAVRRRSQSLLEDPRIRQALEEADLKIDFSLYLRTPEGYPRYRPTVHPPEEPPMSSNYPPGAATDPRAPYNRADDTDEVGAIIDGMTGRAFYESGNHDISGSLDAFDGRLEFTVPTGRRDWDDLTGTERALFDQYADVIRAFASLYEDGLPD